MKHWKIIVSAENQNSILISQPLKHLKNDHNLYLSNQNFDQICMLNLSSTDTHDHVTTVCLLQQRSLPQTAPPTLAAGA